MKHNKRMAGVAGVLLILSATAVQAAKSEDAIKYRRGVMAAQGWQFREMGAVVKGEKPYDKAEFAQRAANVAALSKMALEGFTVEGSESGDTKAKPEAFLELDKVKAAIDKLQSESAKMAQVAATGDMGAIKVQYGELSKVCKGCHDNYRNR